MNHPQSIGIAVRQICRSDKIDIANSAQNFSVKMFGRHFSENFFDQCVISC